MIPLSESPRLAAPELKERVRWLAEQNPSVAAIGRHPLGWLIQLLYDEAMDLTTQQFTERRVERLRAAAGALFLYGRKRAPVSRLSGDMVAAALVAILDGGLLGEIQCYNLATELNARLGLLPVPEEGSTNVQSD